MHPQFKHTIAQQSTAGVPRPANKHEWQARCLRGGATRAARLISGPSAHVVHLTERAIECAPSDTAWNPWDRHPGGRAPSTG